MSYLTKLAQRSLLTAIPATVATTAAVAANSRRETGSAAAGVNAVSHIAWGNEATRHNEPSFKYTLTGLVLNAAAILSWAAIYEMIFGQRARRGNLAAAVAGGAATAALAWVTDFHLVPDRVTPGFEKRLSQRSLLATYALLAASLPVASLLARRK